MSARVFCDNVFNFTKNLNVDDYKRTRFNELLSMTTTTS